MDEPATVNIASTDRAGAEKRPAGATAGVECGGDARPNRKGRISDTDDRSTLGRLSPARAARGQLGSLARDNNWRKCPSPSLCHCSNCCRVVGAGVFGVCRRLAIRLATGLESHRRSTVRRETLWTPDGSRSSLRVIPLVGAGHSLYQGTVPPNKTLKSRLAVCIAGFGYDAGNPRSTPAQKPFDWTMLNDRTAF